MSFPHVLSGKRCSPHTPSQIPAPADVPPGSVDLARGPGFVDLARGPACPRGWLAVGRGEVHQGWRPGQSCLPSQGACPSPEGEWKTPGPVRLWARSILGPRMLDQGTSITWAAEQQDLAKPGVADSQAPPRKPRAGTPFIPNGNGRLRPEEAGLVPLEFLTCSSSTGAKPRRGALPAGSPSEPPAPGKMQSEGP